MRIDRQFSLISSIDVVWESLKDSHLMAQCLPGAELEEGANPDNLKGRLCVRLGPIEAGFDGTVAVTRDESTRGGAMRAQGIDKRTRTRVLADISYQLSSNDGGTTVTLVCDFSLAGALAQFARNNLVDKVASELIEGFSKNLEQCLAQTTPKKGDGGTIS